MQSHDNRKCRQNKCGICVTFSATLADTPENQQQYFSTCKINRAKIGVQNQHIHHFKGFVEYKCYKINSIKLILLLTPSQANAHTQIDECFAKCFLFPERKAHHKLYWERGKETTCFLVDWHTNLLRSSALFIRN